MTSISTLWATLDASVQQWLLRNPGTMMLPRTHVNLVEAGAGQVLQLDEHGEYWLCPEDVLFLKVMRQDYPESVTSPSPRLMSEASIARPLHPHEDALDQ